MAYYYYFYKYITKFKKKKNMKKSNVNFSLGIIVGFFDSDGGFLFHSTKRQDNKLGFSISAQFGQITKNKDTLESVEAVLGKNTKIRDTKSQGKQSYSIYEVFLTSDSGQKLLKIFEEQPPITPGKFRDYLIAIKVLKFIKTRPQNPCLVEQVNSDRISSIAFLWLIDQRTALENKESVINSRYSGYEHIVASADEIKLGEELGSTYLADITTKEKELCDKLKNIPNKHQVLKFLKII